MFLSKYIRHFLLFTFILLNVLRGNANTATVAEAQAGGNSILKAELLMDAKGTIESAPEICSGAAFQQSIHKLKNSFGSNHSFSVKLNSAASFIYFFSSLQLEKAKIPLFLFNRSIII